MSELPSLPDDPTLAGNPDARKAGAANAGKTRLILWLGAAFAVIFAWSAWKPRYPHDWMLENLLVALAIAVLVWIYRRVAFSRSSWVLVFLFLSVHEIGAHWTYSLVPYREFLGMTVGEGSRNHFDRLVHFLYGLLLVWPMRDLLLSLQLVPVRSASLIAINLIISTSTIYELAEWLVGEYVAGELAGAYLGMQGDIWDAQKDIALAAIGSLIAVAAAFLFHFRHTDSVQPSGQPRA